MIESIIGLAGELSSLVPELVGEEIAPGVLPEYIGEVLSDEIGTELMPEFIGEDSAGELMPEFIGKKSGIENGTEIKDNITGSELQSEKTASNSESIDSTAESPEEKSDFERMENEVLLKFKCPEGMDPKEFMRQLKAQQDGLNNMDIQQWLKNRQSYIENGRAPESVEAQKELREKARAERIEANMENGMSYEDASKEADDWLKTKAALHNPDQIAGGDPDNVSMMGDADVNKSIGSQWKGDRINTLESGIKDYAKGKTDDELARTKLNVRLEME